MVLKSRNVYQFRIVLKNITPPIWRRMQVPENYTFLKLHKAIQDAFGWNDYHLHEFTVMDLSTNEETRLGMLSEDGFEDEEILDDSEYRISKFFSPSNTTAVYVYDFGDTWEHKIVLEKILPKARIKYPVCIDGKRACPPEDCGGPWGYEDMLRTISNPKNKEYKSMMVWLGGKFNPEKFDPKGVVFG